MSDSYFRRLAVQYPVLLPTAVWTLLLTLTVSLASLASAAAFMSAVSPSSSPFSRNAPGGCYESSDDVDPDPQTPCGGLVGIPLGVQGEILRVPGNMVRVSEFDILLPTVFAAVAVFSSACLLRSLGLMEAIIPNNDADFFSDIM
ncbi:hypothetical protein SAY87_001235 [Trapa incisa]|uniref:Uncharacterized protein n=1 Tax=Trapa incisa TaxID=236973 RepID=A0AAN7GSS9_9MYRT|nr:hypothetical protein SAY87_001235 [Trapa incisa]